MYILTQNKNNIIKLDHLQIQEDIIYSEKKYYIVNYSDDFILGRYKTKEQAQLILLEIMNNIKKGNNFYIME